MDVKQNVKCLKQSSVSDTTSLFPVLILSSVVSVGDDCKITYPGNVFFPLKAVVFNNFTSSLSGLTLTASVQTAKIIEAPWVRWGIYWYFSIQATSAEPPCPPKEKAFQKPDTMTQHFWKVSLSSLVFAFHAAELKRIEAVKERNSDSWRCIRKEVDCLVISDWPAFHCIGYIHSLNGYAWTKLKLNCHWTFFFFVTTPFLNKNYLLSKNNH